MEGNIRTDMQMSRSRWLAARALLFVVASAIVLVVVSVLPVAPRSPTQEVFTGFVASVGTFALTVLFVRWEGLQLTDVGAMPGKGSFQRFTVGFALGLMLVALHSLVAIAGHHMHWERTGEASMVHASVLLLGYILLATREEMAFHGYPLRILQRHLGVGVAQMLVAAAFAVEHIAGGWSYSQALWGAGMGSMLFGMASIATRGLALPIGLHAAWNFGDWMRGTRSLDGVWRPEIDKGFEDAVGTAGIYSYVAIMAFATFGFWCWHRARVLATARDTQ